MTFLFVFSLPEENFLFYFSDPLFELLMILLMLMTDSVSMMMNHKDLTEMAFATMKLSARSRFTRNALFCHHFTDKL